MKAAFKPHIHDGVMLIPVLKSLAKLQRNFSLVKMRFITIVVTACILRPSTCWNVFFFCFIVGRARYLMLACTAR